MSMCTDVLCMCEYDRSLTVAIAVFLIVRAINGQYKGNLQVGYIWNFIAYISYMFLWDLKPVCCHLNFLEQFFWQPIQKN